MLYREKDNDQINDSVVRRKELVRLLEYRRSLLANASKQNIRINKQVTGIRSSTGFSPSEQAAAKSGRSR